MNNRLFKALAFMLPLFLAGCLLAQELPMVPLAQKVPGTLPPRQLPADLPAQELHATLSAERMPAAPPAQGPPVTSPAQELPVTNPPRQLPITMPEQQSSKAYRTQYTSISYVEIKDLHTFTRNIASGLNFFWGNQEQNPLLAKTQVDKIVDSIFSFLDMHPPNLRFGITLYRTQAEVTAAYRAQGMLGAAPIAFYSHRTRNIAVAIDSITDNILAHEIAHAVISAYFVMPPPARMQEVLAQYVDIHFRDQ